MTENTAQRWGAYNTIGWISFVLGIIVTPLFTILGIVMGVLANKQSSGSGTVVIWANAILLVLGLFVTWIFYGAAGIAFFTIIKSLLGM